MAKQQRQAYVPAVGDHVKTVSGQYGDIVGIDSIPVSVSEVAGNGEIWWDFLQKLPANVVTIQRQDGSSYLAGVSAIIAVIPKGSDQQFVVVRKAGHMSLLPRGTKWAEDQLSLYNRNRIK